MIGKVIYKRWLNFLVISSGIVTKFIMIGKCSWILYQEEIPKDAVKLKDENRSKDRFEGIVEQFIKMI